MTVRPYTPNDYETISSWWTAREWPVIPEAYLPRIGHIVDNHCVAFLYRTDSKIAWLEWTVSNPASDSKERNLAMNLIIESLTKVAKELGYESVFTSSNNEKLISRYENNGFVVTDNSVTHLLRRL